MQVIFVEMSCLGAINAEGLKYFEVGRLDVDDVVVCAKVVPDACLITEQMQALYDEKKHLSFRVQEIDIIVNLTNYTVQYV